MTLRILSLLFAAALVSCSSDPSPAPPASFGATTGSVNARNSAASHSPAGPAHRKLVRSGSQRVQVGDLKIAVRATQSIVTARKGYVESSTVLEGDEADLSLRVPPASLQPTLDEIARLGKETLRRVSVDDVTKQYIDLDAQVTNLRALRDRLRILLSKANTVKDALLIESELAEVQTRLDSLEAQLRTIRSQVAYSRIDLSLQKKRIPGPIGAAGKGLLWGTKKLFVLD